MCCICICCGCGCSGTLEATGSAASYSAFRAWQPILEPFRRISESLSQGQGQVDPKGKQEDCRPCGFVLLSPRARKLMASLAGSTSPALGSADQSIRAIRMEAGAKLGRRLWKSWGSCPNDSPPNAVLLFTWQSADLGGLWEVDKWDGGWSQLGALSLEGGGSSL